MSSILRYSEVDSSGFGIRIARADLRDADEVRAMVASAQEDEIELAIVRCPADSIAVAQAMEECGGRIMDALVYYNRSASALPDVDPDWGQQVRVATSGDVPSISAIAGASFERYPSHFHADPRLDPSRARDAYVSWATRSVLLPEVADEVVVAEREGTIEGFMTLRCTPDGTGLIPIGGVRPECRKRGLYRALLSTCMRRLAKADMKKITVSTQVTNAAVQKVWVRLGFEPSRAVFTFHYWRRRNAE